MVSPIIDDIAEERNDIVVGKINVDEEQELAGEFGVFSIPTIVVMKKGKVTAQATGARPKEQILALLKS
jgi:thioredoxin 1